MGVKNILRSLNLWPSLESFLGTISFTPVLVRFQELAQGRECNENRLRLANCFTLFHAFSRHFCFFKYVWEQRRRVENFRENRFNRFWLARSDGRAPNLLSSCKSNPWRPTPVLCLKWLNFQTTQIPLPVPPLSQSVCPIL